jgi:hypothetical protein
MLYDYGRGIDHDGLGVQVCLQSGGIRGESGDDSGIDCHRDNLRDDYGLRYETGRFSGVDDAPFHAFDTGASTMMASTFALVVYHTTSSMIGCYRFDVLIISDGSNNGFDALLTTGNGTHVLIITTRKQEAEFRNYLL